MKKIFLRVLGYVFCGILMLICIFLIITSSVFGAEKTVEVFGFNVYIVENDDIPAAPEGSAVIVRKIKAGELTEGRLMLYKKAPENGEGEAVPVLGYFKSLEARDGVNYITAAYHNTPYEFAESSLIGSADYSSAFWGGLVRFVRTPLGVLVMAVFPCAAMILFELIRASMKNRPAPEVVPRVKNADEEEPHTETRLSVNNDGKAAYSRNGGLKPMPKDSSVLFNYDSDARLAGRQRSVRREAPPKNSRPIIPLTDKKPEPPEPKAKDNTATMTGRLFDIKIPSEAELPDLSAAAEDEPAESYRPSKAPISISEVSDDADDGRDSSPLVTDKTAELSIARRRIDDAFFAQSGVNRSAPVGRQNAAPQIGSRERPSDTAGRTAGKRSAQILASKNLDDFFDDE